MSYNLITSGQRQDADQFSQVVSQVGALVDAQRFVVQSFDRHSVDRIHFELAGVVVHLACAQILLGRYLVHEIHRSQIDRALDLPK